MSAHVLLALLNKFRKRGRMQDSAEHFITFAMLGSIYHMTLKIFRNSVFGVKMSRLCHINAELIWASSHNVTKTRNSQVVLSILNHDFISLPDGTSCDSS